ncbi:unnamed protein product [Phytophthora fragariaefolia]|uniref:inositol-phosphate phosphatase n=1 Tax=Phytophthora fragariaefolia TaxID=1490495 RepID=A0A9W6X849_9STRA|nr:unnamed protein product [Phytophthora fragariaefolia]
MTHRFHSSYSVPHKPSPEKLGMVALSCCRCQGASENWTTNYYQQEQLRRKSHRWRSLFHPSVLGACLAVFGRTIAGPIVLLLLFTATNYLSPDATFLITSENSFFAFTEKDLSMAGGCTDCLVLLTYALYNSVALTSAPPFTAFSGIPPTESLYDFSSLGPEALALGASLDASDALCQSSVNEWGSAMNVLTGTPQQVMDIIITLNLSIPLQTKRELELGIQQAEECVTTWSIIALPRLFLYPASLNSTEFGEIPAVAINIAPDVTECRPDVPTDENFVGSKLALTTYGRDLLADVPEALTLFPYSFNSSMAPVSRLVRPTEQTKYQADIVLEPLLHAYYGACRVQEVNTTGVYVEDTCEISEHWASYGLMVQSPDDMPLCSTSDVCIHNYYNSQWEWTSEITAAEPNRVVMYMNTFRSRYADKLGISVHPGIVVMQIFIMGIVSLYEVMSHKRSVLLTQIWAYRCQNGTTQVIYLAQVSYHLIYNSDLYLLGFSTGTLTTESLANLTCCFYAFSYSFINLAKSRSGDQQLDRHFRLTWEATQVVITACVVAALRVVQRNPLESIISTNAQILRKTSSLGKKYCGLNDACIMFTVNAPTIITLLSAVLGLVAVMASLIVKRTSPKVIRDVFSSRASQGSFNGIGPTRKVKGSPKIATVLLNKRNQTLPLDIVRSPAYNRLTSFEENCLGVPFRKLFYDCDDFAYVAYNGRRCTTVEALLLTGLALLPTRRASKRTRCAAIGRPSRTVPAAFTAGHVATAVRAQETLDVDCSMAAPTPSDVSAMLDVAVEAARAAGAHMKANLSTSRVEKTKSSKDDLVTVVDKQCQDVVFATIKQRFPTHEFLGEESVAPGSEASARALRDLVSKEWLWIVDPIDGTTNFVHHRPASVVSVACAHLGEVVVGVIYDPYRDELFSAQQGKGAFLNGQPARVSSEASFSEALVGFGIGTKDSVRLPMLDCAREFSAKCRGLRLQGAAAIELAWTAAGRQSRVLDMRPDEAPTARGLLQTALAMGALQLLLFQGEAARRGDAFGVDETRMELLLLGYVGVAAALLLCPLDVLHYKFRLFVLRKLARCFWPFQQFSFKLPAHATPFVEVFIADGMTSLSKFIQDLSVALMLLLLALNSEPEDLREAYISKLKESPLPFFLLCAVFNSLYSFLWDVVMDWGLGQPKLPRRVAFLRHQLTYRPRKIYYLIIAVDFVLRIMWVTKWWDWMHRGVHFKLVSQVAEVVRRIIWNFVRVEWQCIKLDILGTKKLSADSLELEEIVEKMPLMAEDEDEASEDTKPRMRPLSRPNSFSVDTSGTETSSTVSQSLPRDSNGGELLLQAMRNAENSETGAPNVKAAPLDEIIAPAAITVASYPAKPQAMLISGGDHTASTHLRRDTSPNKATPSSADGAEVAKITVSVYSNDNSDLSSAVTAATAADQQHCNSSPHSSATGSSPLSSGTPSDVHTRMASSASYLRVATIPVTSGEAAASGGARRTCSARR